MGLVQAFLPPLLLLYIAELLMVMAYIFATDLLYADTMTLIGVCRNIVLFGEVVDVLLYFVVVCYIAHLLYSV